MKTDKIFWGILLVFIGGIFLLENFGWIDFSWYDVWRFWPVILILIGVNILFSRTNSKIGVLATIVITVAALGILTYKGLERRASTPHWGWNFKDNDEDGDNGEHSSSQNRISTVYSEDYNAKYQVAALNIRGGASDFHMQSGEDKLFESRNKETVNRYYLKKTETDSSVVLDFNSKNRDGNFKFNDDEFGSVEMKLNKQPVWDISLHMGAGKTDFDLSQNKVRTVYLKGGAAAFKVKLGDLYNEVNFTAETGVAKVKVEVPEGAGCEIKTSTGLSSKDFKGFTDKGNGYYQTSNYDTSAKKIHITLKGGLSDFEVDRY